MVMSTQLEKESIKSLCCPECKSEDIRVRIDTDGTCDCVECNNCNFSDYYKGEHRKHPDPEQWKQMYNYSFKFYVAYHRIWEEEKVKAESDEQAREIAKSSLDCDCYGYKRYSKASVYINGVWEEFK
jgi:hypothetical protein